MKKKKGMGFKIGIIIVVIFGLLLWFGDDDDTDLEEDNTAQESEAAEVDAGDEDTSWAIYWYLCGSDLESDGGCATTDLEEMMDVELPENVKVVIETGGASYWESDEVDGSKLQRFVYDSNGLQLVNEQPLADMGDKETLANFLTFAKNNYPADKTMMLFWDHGGGSVAGAAFDEIYDYDSLSLNEMRAAFEKVWDLSQENPPFEVIGFDACLMATIDVASAFSDIGKYLVASEETEPGDGWYYTGWMEKLAQKPSMDGSALGKAICDSYYESCEDNWCEDEVTLSVTDLSKVPALVKAYDAVGKEALTSVCEDSAFFSKFSRAAGNAENYGGNTDEEGYTNMVDLGDLVYQSEELLPNTSDHLLQALEACVIYKVNGSYRDCSSGLSCYYSYNADRDDLAGYEAVGAGSAFKHYYRYGITGQMDNNTKKYAKEEDIDTVNLSEVLSLSEMNWDDMAVDLDDDGYSVLNLGPKADAVLAGIDFELYYMDDEDDIMLFLGTDNDLDADWEKGIFKDNFRGVWGAIDDCLVYMDLTYEGDDYNLYSVPILLNGEDYNLQVVYNFSSEAWEILGARQSIDEAGICDKEMRKLQPGDEITTIHYASSVSGDDDLEPVEVETLTVTKDTSFNEMELPDGTYEMLYKMYDCQGNTAYSDIVEFEYKNGEITTTVFE